MPPAVRPRPKLPSVPGLPVRRLACAAALALAALPGAAAAADEAPELVALIRDPALREISGIAESRRHAGVLWVHNDSGYPAELHAIDRRGRRLATIGIEGAPARD